MATVAEEDIVTETSRYTLFTKRSRLNPSKSACIKADLRGQRLKPESRAVQETQNQKAIPISYQRQ